MNRKQVTRHFPANAFCSFARSSFVICHTSCVTRCSPAGSFTHSAKNFAGVTCQESPYLSASHPHCTSFPPPAVRFSQYTPLQGKYIERNSRAGLRYSASLLQDR